MQTQSVMKWLKCALLIAILSPLSVFADQSDFSLESASSKSRPKQRRNLVRGGMSAFGGNKLVPTWTFGQSWLLRNAQWDVSFTTAGKVAHRDVAERFFVFPEVTYTQRLAPVQVGTLYVGGGLGFGAYEKDIYDGMQIHRVKDFRGFFANAVMGYQFNQASQFNPHLELKIYRGIQASNQVGSNPIIPSLNIGITF